MEFEKKLGRKVDLLTYNSIHLLLKNKIMKKRRDDKVYLIVQRNARELMDL